MIKKILSLALIAAAACGISASAQQNKMYQPQQFTDFAFEGILLDVDQQAKINNINNAFHLNGQPAAEAVKCEQKDCEQKDCDKTDCPKKDCDKKECQKKRDKHMRGQAPSPATDPNIRREYAKQVKQVLTPEQYTVFLENIAFMPQGPQKYHGTVQPGRSYKDAKGKDGQRRPQVTGGDRKVKPVKRDK